LEVACRLCRTPLLHAGGCETCSGWKKNLVVTGDLPEENVDLGDLSNEALRLMRQQLRKLQKLAGTKGLTLADDLVLTKSTQDLARALAVVLAESRKLRKEGVAALRASSFQEQAALFYDWTQSLPPAHRRRVADTLLEKLAEMDGQVRLQLHAPEAGEEDEDDE
jgi:hypothetical protein